MADGIQLHVGQRLVTSPFGLLGTNENALSYALGYTFQQAPELLRWFLRKIGIQNLRSSAFQSVRIDLQRHGSGTSEGGFTDIELHLPGYFHVIVEAKVGLSVPSIDQCQKYLPRLRSTGEPIQKLVALVESDGGQFVERYSTVVKEFSERLVCFRWPELIPECVRLTSSDSVEEASKMWIRSFYRFLDQEYRMKAYTIEVWILPVGTEPLWPGGKSFWDIHQEHLIYFDVKHHTVRPLYFAFRADGDVDRIYRVSRIEHETPVTDVVPELENVEWGKEPHTIWHLHNPVSLPKPLRTGPGMYNRKVQADLDLLLSCETVKEIELEMSKRREQDG